MKRFRWVVFLALAVTAGCGGDDPLTGPGGLTLTFTPGTLDLGTTRSATIQIANTGSSDLGPIELTGGQIAGPGGLPITGSQLASTPSQFPVLRAGATADVSVGVTLPNDIESGSYQANLTARVGDQTAAVLIVDLSVAVVSPFFGTVTITGGPTSIRQGAIETYTAEVRDSTGQVTTAETVTWSVVPFSAGLADAAGRIVGYAPGAASVVASVGGVTDELEVTVVARGAPSGSLISIGEGSITDRFTSDLWVHGNVAYTGTWGCRDASGNQCGNNGLLGNTLYVWDVSVPAAPALADSVQVDARTLNDVKISADGTLGVVTHQGSSDMMTGMTLLDLADPLHPAVISTLADSDFGLGVHNAWIDGNYVYLVLNGSSAASGLKVVDIKTPAAPTIVASFYGGSSLLHDVYVRDGLAFLSHWDAGLIILDVGNGIADGSPTNPAEVGRIDIPGFFVHNAWYWPAAGYVFLGDEVGVPGVMRVIDVRDPTAPVEVASLSIDGATPHNFWIDESRGIGYFAWYENGIQAVDVSGDLMGQLELQGRHIAELQFGSGGCIGTGLTCTWAPQLHNGNVYISEMNTGLRVLSPTF
ncbi:MAG: hypothetical protein ABFS14_11320 [Gemmatimonadota bacterium]